MQEEQSLPTEVLTGDPETSLGKVYLDWMPQPGSYLEIEGKPYTVLERRHNYQFRRGRYRLAKVVINVQATQKDRERSFTGNCWVIGDASCFYNAHSEVLRCAVNPLGPCAGCSFWQPRDEEETS